MSSEDTIQRLNVAISNSEPVLLMFYENEFFSSQRYVLPISIDRFNSTLKCIDYINYNYHDVSIDLIYAVLYHPIERDIASNVITISKKIAIKIYEKYKPRLLNITRKKEHVIAEEVYALLMYIYSYNVQDIIKDGQCTLASAVCVKHETIKLMCDKWYYKGDVSFFRKIEKNIKNLMHERARQYALYELPLEYSMVLGSPIDNTYWDIPLQLGNRLSNLVSCFTKLVSMKLHKRFSDYDCDYIMSLMALEIYNYAGQLDNHFDWYINEKWQK